MLEAWVVAEQPLLSGYLHRSALVEVATGPGQVAVARHFEKTVAAFRGLLGAARVSLL